MQATLKSVIKAINDRAARERKDAAWFFQHFPQIPLKVEEFEDRVDASAWFSYLYGGSFTISLRALDGFKGEELLETLFWVETYFNVELTMAEHPSQGRKVFSADKEWPRGHLSIIVYAELRIGSQSCQRVQVGTTKQVIETPVYELRCDGDEVLS